MADIEIAYHIPISLIIKPSSKLLLTSEEKKAKRYRELKLKLFIVVSNIIILSN